MSHNSPGLIFGQVPSASQWNGYFAQKQDWSPALDAVQAAAPTAALYKITGVFTADGTIGTIPANAMIAGVTFQETAGHTVSVTLGTSLGGSQILGSTSVTASTILGIAASSLLLLAFLANQSVFIHSASWSSASITVTIWYML